MKILIKFFLNLFLRIFNLEIVSKNRQKIFYSFDFDYQKKFGAFNEITIFDVGANKGQSINRFRSIFKNSIIHSFEPDKECYEILLNKFDGKDKLFINDTALSNNFEEKEFNIYENSTDNSFYKKTNDKVINKIIVKTQTLDDYINKNNIKNIDILKIDTQSFNKEVIEGAQNSLNKRIIDILEIEVNLGNYYNKKNTFYEIEKYLKNYKLAGINKGGSIIDNEKFYLDVYYVRND